MCCWLTRSRIWNFLIAFFTPFITSAIDFRYGYVFAGCNFLAFLLVYFFVIETKGVSLEEADKLYRDKTPARGSSKLAKSLARKKKNREAAGLTTADLRPVDDAHRSAADEVAVEV
jgi:SP family sugar:H+ symporter-like MFS transporter